MSFKLQLKYREQWEGLEGEEASSDRDKIAEHPACILKNLDK